MLCRTSAYVLGLWWVWVGGRGRLRGERWGGVVQQGGCWADSHLGGWAAGRSLEQSLAECPQGPRRVFALGFGRWQAAAAAVEVHPSQALQLRGDGAVHRGGGSLLLQGREERREQCMRKVRWRGLSFTGSALPTCCGGPWSSAGAPNPEVWRGGPGKERHELRPERLFTAHAGKGFEHNTPLSLLHHVPLLTT